MLKPPESIRIELGGAHAEVVPSCGALLTSYYAANRQIIYKDEKWYDGFPKSARLGNPILFPIASKVEFYGKPDTYQYRGNTYNLPQHGFARYLPWKVIDVTGSSVVCQLNSSPLTLLTFPWEFELQLTYTLTADGLTSKARITNLSPDPMPVHFGFHPYLHLDSAQSKYIIRVPDAERVSLVSGPKSEPVKPTQRELLITSSLAMTRMYQKVSIGRFELVNRETGKSTTIEALSKAFTTWAIWTPQSNSDFVCIEPWTGPPNSMNQLAALPQVESGKYIDLEMFLRPL